MVTKTNVTGMHVAAMHALLSLTGESNSNNSQWTTHNLHLLCRLVLRQ